MSSRVVVLQKDKSPNGRKNRARARPHRESKRRESKYQATSSLRPTQCHSLTKTYMTKKEELHCS